MYKVTFTFEATKSHTKTLKTKKKKKIFFPHTPRESDTFPPCGLDEGATFR